MNESVKSYETGGERLTTDDLSLATADDPMERFGKRHSRTVYHFSEFDIDISDVLSCPVSVVELINPTEVVNGSVATITPAPYKV